jgi:hypothetical protein
MENNFSNQSPVNPVKKPTTEVVVLKVLIIFVIAIIPVAFMLMDLTKKLAGLKNAQTNQNLSVGQDYDFKAQLPSGTVGDINAVPQEKIDSLFSNLK